MKKLFFFLVWLLFSTFSLLFYLVGTGFKKLGIFLGWISYKLGIAANIAELRGENGEE